MTSLLGSKTTVKVGQVVRLAKPGTEIEYDSARFKKGADLLLTLTSRQLGGEKDDVFVPFQEVRGHAVAGFALPAYVSALRSPDCPNKLADLRHLPKDSANGFPESSPPTLPSANDPPAPSSASAPASASSPEAPATDATATRKDAPVTAPSGCDCAVPQPVAPAVGDVAYLAFALVFARTRRLRAKVRARRG